MRATVETDWRRAEPSRLDGGRVGTLAIVLVFVAALTPFLVSSMLLSEFNIPYDTAGGSPLSKIHPATYLTILALAVYLVATGHPMQFARKSAERFPSLIVFVPILALLFTWTVFVQKTPITNRLDTFVPPAIMLALIGDLSEKRHRLLTTLLHIVLTANAVIGIGEVATGLRLTPFAIGGQVIDWDWRATALLGHPLDNALFTGLYLLTLYFGADRAIPNWLRLPMIGLQLVALVSFGGRTALIAALAIILASLAWRFARVLAGARFDARIAAAIVVALPIVIAGFIAAFESGLFDRLMERFTNDDGSAATRVAMLRILASFSLHDLLLGPDQEVLTEQMWLEGSYIAIESFVIGFFVQSGILISLILFAGLAAFSADLWRIGGRYALWQILYFYFVAAGSASLSEKTQMLAQFVILIATIEARPGLGDAPAAASDSAAGRLDKETDLTVLPHTAP
ncbi:MAG: VpsF family polysaccharide biosynthesis protein [Ancalomicrobiaceae bacterium]|nr:VpsF family polysaccharide biosynthesis protein [Ancalomicrobiaceae bacterium]